MYVTLGISLNFCRPQFPHLLKEELNHLSLWNVPQLPPDLCEAKVGLFPINPDEADLVVYLRIS